MLLLVDDDNNQLAMRRVILERLGYSVLTAGDAYRGMQLFKSEAPDAVVLDYEMPAINGGVLAERIRRANCSIPIVMLSACGSVPTRFLKAVNTFICKPTAPSCLINAIEFLTRSREVAA
jgi:DNA-binding response OmpR family regulator